MSVEIYETVGGEKIQRLIARHERVQSRLEAEAKHLRNKARMRLQASRRTHMNPDLSPRERAKAYRNQTRVYYSAADIDHHVGLYRPDGKEYYVEHKLSILRKTIGSR